MADNETTSEFYLDEKNLIENNKVQFELSRPIDSNDVDVLEMFLESKKQSGGGEILNINYSSSMDSSSATLKRLSSSPVTLVSYSFNNEQTKTAAAAADSNINDDDKQLVNTNSSTLQLDDVLETDINRTNSIIDSAAQETKAGKRSLVVIYEEKEAKERMLKRRFIRFKDYLIRSSEFGSLFMANESYELEPNLLIVQNIDENEEKCVIELYAEQLQPDNDLLEIKKSDVFEKSYLLKFKEKCDFQKLYARYQKKPNLRNKRVDLFKAHKTNCLLIKSSTPAAAGAPSSSFDLKPLLEMCSELNAVAATRSLDESSDTAAAISNSRSVMFVHEALNYALIQFESEHLLNEFLDSYRTRLQSASLVHEYCWNFDYLRMFLSDDETKTQNQISQQQNQQQQQQQLLKQQTEKKLTRNKSTQTDLTNKMLTAMYVENRKNKTLLAAQNNVPRRDSEPIAAASSKSNNKKNQNDLNEKNRQTKIPSPPPVAESILVVAESSSDPLKVYLNPNQPLTLALQHCRQLMLNLNDYLGKYALSAKVESKKDEAANGGDAEKNFVFIKVKDKIQRNKSIGLLHEFYKTQFATDVIMLKDYLRDSKMLTAETAAPLVEHLKKINHRYPASCFELNSNLSAIHVGGVPKPMAKVVDIVKEHLRKDFKIIINNVINSNNSSNKLNDSTTFGKPRSMSQLSAGSSASSDRKSPNEINRLPALTPPLIDLNNHCSEQLKPSAPLSQINLNSVTVLISSFDPEVNRFKLFDRQTNKFMFIITEFNPCEYPVLIKCLFYCAGIFQDFYRDLIAINSDLELVYSDLNQTQTTTMTTYSATAMEESCSSKPSKVLAIVAKSITAAALSSEMAAFLSAKVGMLLNDYETQKLKYKLIKIKDILSREEFYEDLIKQLKKKNDMIQFMKAIEMEYGSMQVLHMELKQNESDVSTNISSAAAAAEKSCCERYFELYGYEKAVKKASTHVHANMGKLSYVLQAKMQAKLEFQLSLKKVPNLIVFFKFNGIYFKDFSEKLKQMEAHVTKLDKINTAEQKTAATASNGSVLQFSCSNALLLDAKPNEENWDLVEAWRKRIDQFISVYLSMFAIEIVDMPFKRDDPMANELLYDTNLIDIVWITNQKLQVIGYKEEMTALKQKIFQM